jgi:hypothetical protein
LAGASGVVAAAALRLPLVALLPLVAVVALRVGLVAVAIVVLLVYACGLCTFARLVRQAVLQLQ